MIMSFNFLTLNTDNSLFLQNGHYFVFVIRSNMTEFCVILGQNCFFFVDTYTLSLIVNLLSFLVKNSILDFFFEVVGQIALIFGV